MRAGSFKGALQSTLVIALLIVPVVSLLSVSPVHAALTPHDPILIDGNGDFTPANGVTSGSGTAGDPYIIEGWDINVENDKGIEIRNTTAHFIIRNVYVYGEEWKKKGISFTNVINGKIDNVKTACYVGIRLGYSSSLYITGSLILGIPGGGEGILLHSSNNVHIIGSNIMSGENVGIFLRDSNSNFISGCAVENAYIGIGFERSFNNIIWNNTIRNSLDSGIVPYLSDNNFIYHNNFVNNENHAHDSGSNYYDNGYPSGGNYWDDYTGVDADNDGIGDTPYYVPGDNNRDRYPLMNPWSPPPPLPTPPVGGIVTPVNKFALLAPWIVLGALITIAAVSVAVYWRRM